jgi:hypothetical protein
MAASRMTIRDCIFTAQVGPCVNYLEGTAANHGIVDSCVAVGTGPLVFSSSSDYQDVINCVALPNNATYAVQTSGANSTIINCSFYGTQNAGTSAWLIGTTSGGVVTNCALEKTGGGIITSAVGAAAQIQNCCWYGFANLDVTGSATVTNTINEDPKFKDPSTGDLTPESDSPCLNAGLTVAAITVDILGATRTAGFYDIGAYEMDFAPGDPTIKSLRFTDKTTLRITFSEDMNQNADLSLASNYTFQPVANDHDASVSSVSVITATVVDLTVVGVRVNRRYTLSIGGG